MAPTVIALDAEAGETMEASLASLPAATTVITLDSEAATIALLKAGSQGVASDREINDCFVLDLLGENVVDSPVVSREDGRSSRVSVLEHLDAVDSSLSSNTERLSGNGASNVSTVAVLVIVVALPCSPWLLSAATEFRVRCSDTGINDIG